MSLFPHSDLENFSITSFSQQWILLSEWVPSQQESTSNPHNSSPSINIMRSEKLFEINKSIKMF